MRDPHPTKNGPQKGPGAREFIALVAALMASNALAIDAMLPALPAIGHALGVAEENRRQLVITSYLLGFGAAQLLYGPLADRFGRKALLIGGLAIYGIFGIASSFTLLLAARAVQGAAAAATRVLVVSIVRDRYQGSAMAQIMSTVMIVFMIVPVLAPAFGQAVLAVASWRHIFIALGVYGAVLALWTWFRLPETLRPEHKRPLSLGKIGEAVWTTLKVRQSIGNTIALTLLMGALFAFINSIQQIVFDVFGRPELIGLVFALIAGPMAISSYANSRLVMRL
jgi:MFS transporter, DHA1 family, multidrug resistance protein